MNSLGLPLSVLLFWLIYIPSISVGLWKGAVPERIGAGTLCAIPALQFTWYASYPAAYEHVDPISLSVDLVGVVGFGFLALNAKRAWPIWACAFQLFSLAGHFARMVEISGHPAVYAWMKSSPTLLAAVSVLIGTLTHRRRLMSTGVDASWVDWKAINERRTGIRQTFRTP